MWSMVIWRGGGARRLWQLLEIKEKLILLLVFGGSCSLWFVSSFFFCLLLVSDMFYSIILICGVGQSVRQLCTGVAGRNWPPCSRRKELKEDGGETTPI